MPSEFALADFDAVHTPQGSTLMLPRSGTASRALLVLLPYTDGSAQDLLRLWYADAVPRHALEHGYLVLIPQVRGARADYSSRAAWQDTLQRYQDALSTDVETAIRDYGVDPTRVALAGHSMGGDLAWALMLRDNERYAGAVIMGSQASYRDAHALQALGARGARLFLYAGSADPRRKALRTIAPLLDDALVPHRWASAPGRHVPAPPALLLEGIDYALRLREGPAAPRLPSLPRMATSSERPERLPACDWQPYRDRASERYGYRDARGKIPVPPRFDAAAEFGEDGLAAIVEAQTTGYLDCEARKFAVLAEQGAPDVFREGLARFVENGRIGYLNRRGDIVIAARYEQAQAFCGGVARVQRDGQVLAIDPLGTELQGSAPPAACSFPAAR